tara:strand:- start:14832 stop:15743 length:912 start_codon:yes stop_codon:yes gene_type:complete
MNILRKFVCCLLLVITCQILLAQERQKLQVVTKTIEKDLRDVLDSGILIKGRKAEVTVTGWDKEYIRVEMDLISKHPNKKVAVEELEYIQYAISKTEHQYVLRNMFYSVANKTKIRSSLSVKYRIYVPLSQSVTVNNEYGSIDLLNLYGQIKIDGNFCDVNMERLFGTVMAKLSYGEITGNHIDGRTNMQVTRSNMKLIDFAGEMRIDNEYGNIEISPSTLLKSLDVKSRHGKVNLTVNRLDAFNYNVSVNGSYIDLPEAQSDKVKLNDLENSYSFKVENGLSKAHININNLLFPVKIVAKND